MGLGLDGFMTCNKNLTEGLTISHSIQKLQQKCFAFEYTLLP